MNIEKFNPKNGERFSPNLYKWLKKYKKRYHNQNLVVCTDTQSTRKYIGCWDDEMWFYGTQLMSVLCSGVGVDIFAYPPKQTANFIIIPDFWKNYEKIGRCIIDPSHYMDFLNAENRYKVNGIYRACNWCGHTQQLIKWTETKEREAWRDVVNPSDDESKNQ